MTIPLGLSPRMRGNLRQRGSAHGGRGSIPAHAGEPKPAGRLQLSTRVYPRACGGTRGRVGGYRSDVGLSPRMRGNHPEVNQDALLLGSIPAHAGEPRRGRARCRRVRVYPRACGGTRGGLPGPLATEGLSPRMRGNRRGGLGLQPGRGSIPAHAGEPGRRPRACPAGRVYPRACGGTDQWDLAGGSAGGLSPRMRGNPLRRQAVRPQDGSIPAHAGKPVGARVAGRRRWVYPRACGETKSF